jgi:hypothetical protein
VLFSAGRVTWDPALAPEHHVQVGQRMGLYY